MTLSTFLVLALALAPPEPIEVPPPEPVAGLVADAEGRPVAGVEVFLMGNPVESGKVRKRILWSGRSDAQGRFVAVWPKETIQPFPVPFAGLLAYRPGMRPAVSPLTIPPSSPPGEPVRLVLRLATGVPIRVLDPDGAPVAGARFRVTGVAGQVSLAEELANRFAATTDADGRANLEAFSTEDVDSCEVTTPRFGTQVVRFDLHEIGERAVKLRAVGRLLGRVVADVPEHARGVFIRGSTYSGNQNPDTGRFEAISDAEGRFEVAALQMGRLLAGLNSHPVPGLVLQKPQPDRSIEAGKQTEMVLVFERGIPVRGLVRERETGRPIKGASISLGARPSGDSAETRTDAEGRYEVFLRPGQVQINRLQAGPYVSPAKLPLSLAMIADGADAVELPPIELVRGVEVRGVVLDEEGRPVGGATVEAVRPDGTALSRRFLGSPAATTNGRGEFRIGGAIPGTPLELLAVHDDAASGPPEAVLPGPDKPIKLVVSPKTTTSLGGRVLDEYGKPIADARVTITARSKTSTGVVVMSLTSRIGWGWDLRTDAEGKFQTPHQLRRHEEIQAWASAPGKVRGQSEWFAPTTPSFFDLTLYRIAPPEQAEIRADYDAGWAAHGQGDYAAAEKRFEAAIDKAEKRGIKEPLDLSYWLAGLAEARLHLGKPAEAEELARRVRDLREKALGPMHPGVADALDLIARACHDQDKLNEAEAIRRAALDIRERAQGPDDPSVSNELSRLAWIEMKQGHFAEAEADARRAIAGLERTLGREHVEVMDILNCHAFTLAQLGRPAEAVPVYRRALAIAEKNPGPSSSTILNILDLLSTTLRQDGREAEADEDAARARSIREKEDLKKLPPPPVS